jgi:hypothetical protein
MHYAHAIPRVVLNAVDCGQETDRNPTMSPPTPFALREECLGPAHERPFGHLPRIPDGIIRGEHIEQTHILGNYLRIFVELRSRLKCPPISLEPQIWAVIKYSISSVCCLDSGRCGNDRHMHRHRYFTEDIARPSDRKTQWVLPMVCMPPSVSGRAHHLFLPPPLLIYLYLPSLAFFPEPQDIRSRANCCPLSGFRDSRFCCLSRSQACFLPPSPPPQLPKTLRSLVGHSLGSYLTRMSSRSRRSSHGG